MCGSVWRGGAPAAPLFRGQRIDQPQGLHRLQRLVEESIRAEPKAEIPVLGTRVIGEDHFRCPWDEPALLQRLQYIESAAGSQTNVDQDQIRLQGEQIANGYLRV